MKDEATKTGQDTWEYKGHVIEQRWYPKPGCRPFPDSFVWQHPDYDGPEDDRCGFSTDLEGCIEAIDSMLECEMERERRAWEDHTISGRDA